MSWRAKRAAHSTCPFGARLVAASGVPPRSSPALAHQLGKRMSLLGRTPMSETTRCRAYSACPFQSSQEALSNFFYPSLASGFGPGRLPTCVKHYGASTFSLMENPAKLHECWCCGHASRFVDMKGRARASRLILPGLDADSGPPGRWKTQH